MSRVVDRLSWLRGDLLFNSLNQLPVYELCACGKEGPEVRGIDPSPASLRCLDELERHAERRLPGRPPRVTLVRALTGEKFDRLTHMGCEVRRWLQCSAG